MKKHGASFRDSADARLVLSTHCGCLICRWTVSRHCGIGVFTGSPSGISSVKRLAEFNRLCVCASVHVGEHHEGSASCLASAGRLGAFARSTGLGCNSGELVAHEDSRTFKPRNTNSETFRPFSLCRSDLFQSRNMIVLPHLFTALRGSRFRRCTNLLKGMFLLQSCDLDFTLTHAESIATGKDEPDDDGLQRHFHPNKVVDHVFSPTMHLYRSMRSHTSLT